MKAEDKLAEAKYFLEKLKSSINSELGYNLSAFIQAWRSVFDVLLYDYAEQYFGYSEERKFKTTKNSFREIAIVLDIQGNDKPKKFIEWYQKKEAELSKERFWTLRIFFVHRGGKSIKEGSTTKKTLILKPIEVYLPPSAISGDAISPYASIIVGGTEVTTEKELTIAGMPETVIHAESERVFDIMDKIVSETREKF